MAWILSISNVYLKGARKITHLNKRKLIIVLNSQDENMGCKHIIGFGCIVHFVSWKNSVQLRKCDKQLRFMSHESMHVEFVLNNVEFILHIESISNNHVEFILNNGWFPSVAQETLNSVGDINNSFPCQYELTVLTAQFHVNTNWLY